MANLTDTKVHGDLQVSNGITGAYRSATVWATTIATEDAFFNTFSFIPVGTTILASGAYNDGAYDCTVVAIQRYDENNIRLHKYRQRDTAIAPTWCTKGSTTRVATLVNIAY